MKVKTVTRTTTTRGTTGFQVIFKNYRRIFFADGEFTTEYIGNSRLLDYLQAAMNELTTEEKEIIGIYNNIVVKSYKLN